MPKSRNANWINLTNAIIAYLKEKDPDILPVYIELNIQFRLDHISNPELVAAFERTVRTLLAADKALQGTRDTPTFIIRILNHGYMQEWQSRYAARYPHRADWIGAALQYAEHVGPFLGRALLCMRNPGYLLLISMSLCTPTAFATTGRWPDIPPVGERWFEGEWQANPGSGWEPVEEEILRAQFATDYVMGCRWMPKHTGKTFRDVINSVPLMLSNTSAATIKKLEDFRRHIGAMDSEGMIPTYAVPALAIAFDLSRRQINDYEFWTQANLGWNPVQIPQPIRDRICQFIRTADKRGHELLIVADEDYQVTGERMLNAANIQLGAFRFIGLILVYAANRSGVAGVSADSASQYP